MGKLRHRWSGDRTAPGSEPSSGRARRQKLGSAELLAGALPGSRTAAAVSHSWHRQAGFIARSAMMTPPKKKSCSSCRALLESTERGGWVAPIHHTHTGWAFPPPSLSLGPRASLPPRLYRDYIICSLCVICIGALAVLGQHRGEEVGLAPKSFESTRTMQLGGER